MKYFKEISGNNEPSLNCDVTIKYLSGVKNLTCYKPLEYTDYQLPVPKLAELII